MDTKTFRDWLGKLDSLTAGQRAKLGQTLRAGAPRGSVAQSVVNQRAAEVLACPHCYAASVVGWGREGGVQRYRCRSCSKTFNALTGTPMAHLKRRDAWLVYAQALWDGLSVRKAASQAGVHRTTSFRWRHRWLEQPSAENDTELGSIVEADETYFLESFKGQRELPRPARHRGGCAAKRGLSAEQIPVFVAQDREGKHYDAVLPKADKPTLGCLLGQLLVPDAILCTDGAGVYRSVAKAGAIAHQALNHAAGTRVKQRIFHIQHVNAYDSRLKQWMQRFHGVATKYLPHYLGWRRLLEHSRDTLTPQAVLLHAVG